MVTPPAQPTDPLPGTPAFSTMPSSSGPRKNYSMTKWSPRATGGGKKNYSMTKWTPQGAFSVTSSAPAYSAPTMRKGDAPEPVIPRDAGQFNSMPTPSGVRKNYSMTKWSPRGASSSNTAPAYSAPAAPTMSQGNVPEPVVPSYAGSLNSMPVPPAAPRKNYSMTKWSPRSGASIPAASYVPPPAVAPPAPSAADLASQWASSNRDSDGPIAQPQMDYGKSAAPEKKEVPSAASAMADLARQWALASGSGR